MFVVISLATYFLVYYYFGFVGIGAILLFIVLTMEHS